MLRVLLHVGETWFVWNAAPLCPCITAPLQAAKLCVKLSLSQNKFLLRDVLTIDTFTLFKNI